MPMILERGKHLATSSLVLRTMAFQGRRLRLDGLGRPSYLLRSVNQLVAGCLQQTTPNGQRQDRAVTKPR